MLDNITDKYIILTVNWMTGQVMKTQRILLVSIIVVFVSLMPSGIFAEGGDGDEVSEASVVRSVEFEEQAGQRLAA